MESATIREVQHNLAAYLRRVEQVGWQAGTRQTGLRDCQGIPGGPMRVYWVVNGLPRRMNGS